MLGANNTGQVMSLMGRCVTKALEPAVASLRYINPEFATQVRSELEWWPTALPPKPDEARALEQALGLKLAETTSAASAEGLAIESGRSVLIACDGLYDSTGSSYPFIDLKGVGAISEFAGAQNPLNRWNQHGYTSVYQSYVDLARMNILRSAGVETPLGLAILQCPDQYIEEDSRGRHQHRAAIYARACRTNLRLFHLRELPPEVLQAVLLPEARRLLRQHGTCNFGVGEYLLWFAERMATQAARMQALRYLHGALHAQQVFIDGSVCDFEHEHGTGFLKDPKPDFHYVDPHYTVERQPQHFASLVADSSYSDSLWTILRPLGDAAFPTVEEVLARYWDAYSQEAGRYRPPDINGLVRDYALDDTPALQKLFGSDDMAPTAEHNPVPLTALATRAPSN